MLSSGPHVVYIKSTDRPSEHDNSRHNLRLSWVVQKGTYALVALPQFLLEYSVLAIKSQCSQLVLPWRYKETRTKKAHCKEATKQETRYKVHTTTYNSAQQSQCYGILRTFLDPCVGCSAVLSNVYSPFLDLSLSSHRCLSLVYLSLKQDRKPTAQLHAHRVPCIAYPAETLLLFLWCWRLAIVASTGRFVRDR